MIIYKLALICLLPINILFAETNVILTKATGDVKIRRGVEETWQPTSGQTQLDEIDSILTGENSQAVLTLPDGKTFTLNSNSILDIADLRRITEQELFLYLMSQKVNRLEKREEKTPLKIGNISVVHGELKTKPQSNMETEKPQDWQLEKNGALALSSHGYITNAVLKLNKILVKYPNLGDCGEISFNLGKGFEQLDQTGQALAAYQEAVASISGEHCSAANWLDEAERAIRRLRQ